MIVLGSSARFFSHRNWSARLYFCQWKLCTNIFLVFAQHPPFPHQISGPRPLLTQNRTDVSLMKRCFKLLSSVSVSNNYSKCMRFSYLLELYGLPACDHVCPSLFLWFSSLGLYRLVICSSFRLCLSRYLCIRTKPSASSTKPSPPPQLIYSSDLELLAL